MQKHWDILFPNITGSLARQGKLYHAGDEKQSSSSPMWVRMEAWEKTRSEMPTASAIFEGLGTRLAGCLGKYPTFALHPSEGAFNILSFGGKGKF
jgi:hypothetical protein